MSLFERIRASVQEFARDVGEFLDEHQGAHDWQAPGKAAWLGACQIGGPELPVIIEKVEGDPKYPGLRQVTVKHIESGAVRVVPAVVLRPR